jgi:peroxiredoxin
MRAGIAVIVFALTWLVANPLTRAQNHTVLTPDEGAILERIRTLRSLPDDVRARTTKELALEIRALPASENKVALADDLANLSTEGDFGRDTLQEVTTTLGQSLRGHPIPEERGAPAEPYVELARLARYEHMQASSDSPQFSAAMAKLESDDQARQKADFTLRDIDGKNWTLHDLRGKVVAVNFWATWCPPCRKEMPDLDTLYKRFKDQGFVVLAISDEDISKVRPFIAAHDFTYPILLDPGGSVHKLYVVEGIPQTFVYDREGRLVAQSIDMRTEQQFLEMLAKAGLR